MLVQLAVLAIAARQAAAATCYDRYGYAYNCNNGLAYGARVGIAAGIAVGVFVLLCLCGVWRRRQLKSQWAKYRPPALPYNNNNQTQGGQPQYGQYQYGQSNSYANNPPPPSNFGRQYESQNGLPQQPPQTYQPSMAGQYGFGQRDGVGKTNGAAAAGVGATEDHEHGYEWAQAREQERIEREQAEAGGAAPPGYEVANQTFSPPAGPPPGKQTSGTV